MRDASPLRAWWAQVRGEGLPKALWDVTVFELFFGREATSDREGMHGILSMDACAIDGAVRDRDVLLVQRFVAPLMRAMAQVAIEREAPAAAATIIAASLPAGAPAQRDVPVR